MLPRVLEPEAMDDQGEVDAYDKMDHAEVNRQFVVDFLRTCAPENKARILDLGTGTALIPIELLQQSSDLELIGLDTSEAMIEKAKQNITAANLQDQISVEIADCAKFGGEEEFDLVISNTLIHHLPDPFPCLQNAVSLLKPGGQVFIRDLVRPETEDAVEELVERHAADQTETQQQLLRQSLQAALSLDEIQSLVAKISGLSGMVTLSSDRHWTLFGMKQ